MGAWPVWEACLVCGRGLGGGRGFPATVPFPMLPGDQAFPTPNKSSILGHTRGIHTALLYLVAMARQRTVPPLEKALMHAGWDGNGRVKRSLPAQGHWQVL